MAHTCYLELAAAALLLCCLIGAQVRGRRSTHSLADFSLQIPAVAALIMASRCRSAGAAGRSKAGK